MEEHSISWAFDARPHSLCPEGKLNYRIGLAFSWAIVQQWHLEYVLGLWEMFSIQHSVIIVQRSLIVL